LNDLRSNSRQIPFNLRAPEISKLVVFVCVP
jgi:hypothetical protein